MKTRKTFTQSASKHMTLNQLKQIKKDNFVGANGVDYCPFELEARIQEIETKQAMAFVSSCNALENQRAKYMKINDKLAQPKKEINIFKMNLNNNSKPMFPINMALEMAV